MIFKRDGNHLPLESPTGSLALKTIKNKGLKKILLLVLCIFILAVLAAFFISAIYLKGWNSSHHFSKIHKETIHRKLSFIFQPYRWLLSHIPSSNPIPNIYIDIKFNDFQKISAAKERAWKHLGNVSRPDDWVPAKITYNGDVKKIKLRLTGKTINHMIGNKWSYRINIKSGNSLFGMRRINIRHPKTRNFESEILFFLALRREGILAPRYFFANIIINGKDIGIMSLEEHMGKELLESQNRKEAPIIRFDDDLFYQAYASRAPFKDIFRNYNALPIKIIGSNPQKKSKDFRTHLELAIGLLRGFVEGKILASDVFDPILTGRYLAISRIWGAEHSLEFDDARFYYNPITAKLELIGHDGKVLQPGIQTFIYPNRPLIKHLLADPKIKFYFSETLQRINKEFQNDVPPEWVQNVQKKSLSILRREFYSYEGLDFQKIKTRASANYKADQGLFNNYPNYLNIHYIDGVDGTGVLEVTNILPNSVDINSIKITHRLTGKKEEGVLQFPKAIPVLLEGTEHKSKPNIKRIFLNKSYDIENFNIEISSSIKNSGTTAVHKAIPYYPALNSSPIPSRTISQTLDYFHFITQIGPSTLLIEQGEWDVGNWLYIPQDFRLVIQEGVVLNFAPSFGIISKGAIMINGTTDNPVVLRGSDRKKSKGSWQGILVSDTKNSSVWSHVTIENTTGINTGGWSLTGGTTFYQADVVLDNATFSGNLCENSLNIVRSNFELNGVNISNALSDGFDSDFSKGTVTKGTFKNIGLIGGGDAIDLSGTTMKITGTKFMNIGDKAISVGENSTLIGTKLFIENVVAGVVSKDGSHVSLENTSIKGFKVAPIMAYIKKHEFGPATIVANHIKADGIPDSIIAENESQVIIDGIEVPTKALDVEHLYAKTMKPALK